MKKVVVTGANGHLGYALVKVLQERGYQVRATVRDTHDTKKTFALKKQNVELVQADLMDRASLDHVLQGMDGLFQAAAVFDLTSDDPENAVIRTNVEGTRNILEAAHQAGIKKVIYTSSIGAVGTIAAGETPLDESHWNNSAVEPYAISKTRSEKLAWELASKFDLNLVSILPGTMIGPDFERPTASLQAIVDLLDGKFPMALPMSFSYTDVRDVAMAHVLAYENPQAKGRYIATTETISVAQMCRIIKGLRPETKVSDKIMPVWLARLLPAFDAIQHKLTGSPRQLKNAVMQEYLNREQAYASTRLKQELGWQTRPLHDSFNDTVEWIEPYNALPAFIPS